MKKTSVLFTCLSMFAIVAVAPSFADQDILGAYKATNIIDKNVKDLAGNNLGEIKELVIDPATGQIGYAVLSSGGFLGMGNKYFAIPWKSLKHNEDYLTLSVSEKALENAPGFDKDNWPELSDRQYGQKVHSYYNAQPYWETSPSQAGAASPSAAGKPTRLKGEVLGIEKDTYLIKDQAGREVRLRVDGATKMPREFMPGEKIDAQVTLSPLADSIQPAQ